jgi:hypothetical protein
MTLEFSCVWRDILNIQISFNLFQYYIFLFVLLHRSSCSVNQVTEFTIKGLHEGKEYEFRAAACNKAGTGEFSNCSEPIQVQSLQGMIILSS